LLKKTPKPLCFGQVQPVVEKKKLPRARPRAWTRGAIRELQRTTKEADIILVISRGAQRTLGRLSKVSERLQSQAAHSCWGRRPEAGGRQGGKGRLLPPLPRALSMAPPQRPLAATAAASPSAPPRSHE